MPGIGIISNPYARINKFNPNHNTMMWYILGNQGQFEVTISEIELSRVCREFKDRNIDRVGIVGGDGTISLVLSALLREYGQQALPQIIILRGGTVNVLAANLGIFGKPKTVLSDYLEKIHQGPSLNYVTLPTINVNGHLGFLFANGMASKFLAKFYENKSNALAAGLLFTKVLADGLLNGAVNGSFAELSMLEKIEVTLTQNEVEQLDPFEIDSSLMFAATIPKLPFGFKAFNRVDPIRRQGEAIFISDSKRALIGQALRVLTSRPLRTPGARSIAFGGSLSIKVPMNSSYTVDGDLYKADKGTLDISIGPSFTFCSPYKIPNGLFPKKEDL